jgi:SAM-dependent methyltransferase
MIEWCRANLAPRAPGFTFQHHDVYYVNFNPGARDRRPVLPFPAAAGEFSLIEAWSVFTHLTQSQAEHYLRECARVLRPDGYLHTSWFLFDKRDFPMLHDELNSLYSNEHDLATAVIFDKGWLKGTAAAAGLLLTQAIAPQIRGYHWTLVLRPDASGAAAVELPDDLAERGRSVAPPMPPQAHRIGLR